MQVCGPAMTSPSWKGRPRSATMTGVNLHNQIAVLGGENEKSCQSCDRLSCRSGLASACGIGVADTRPADLVLLGNAANLGASFSRRHPFVRCVCDDLLARRVERPLTARPREEMDATRTLVGSGCRAGGSVGDHRLPSVLDSHRACVAEVIGLCRLIVPQEETCLSGYRPAIKSPNCREE